MANPICVTDPRNQEPICFEIGAKFVEHGITEGDGWLVNEKVFQLDLSSLFAALQKVLDGRAHRAKP